MAIHVGAEIVTDALDCQVQTFGVLLDCQMQTIDMLLGKVCGMWMAVHWLSTSGVSSLQVAASTMDTEDVDGAVGSDSVESRDDEDGKRVDIMGAGTSVDLGESAVEEEVEGGEEKDEEDEVEGSGPVHMAEVEMFMPPAPLGCIRMPHPTTRAWKGKEVETMRWEEI